MRTPASKPAGGPSHVVGRGRRAAAGAHPPQPPPDQPTGAQCPYRVSVLLLLLLLGRGTNPVAVAGMRTHAQPSAAPPPLPRFPTASINMVGGS